MTQIPGRFFVLIMEVFGHTKLEASMKDVLAESIYPLDSRILLVPLNQEAEEHNHWLKFLDLSRWMRAGLPAFYNSYGLQLYTREFAIELDHPFVPVVSDFAVAAFNELCRMYVKKGVEDNIYEAEVTNVNYTINVYGYKFIITLEALEEDAVGVYEATVLCHCSDGRRTLLKFIRLPCPPVGRKFKGMTELVREKSMCQAGKSKRRPLKLN
uniref:uncharacterized protein LOC122594048 n=1 Tax=Erigeron canadensis TaxID=72917 RepID=UPI001CB9A5BE|nr:uncharacterized protein LOC122594048 [Erigeron canadensis]